MSFTKVYVSLKELFPQVDARALRAVAIEHRKDVDAAVVAVVEEIIPFFTERSAPNSPFNRSVYGEGGSYVSTETLARVQNDRSFVSGNREPSSSWDDAYTGSHVADDGTAELTFSMGNHEDRMNMNANVHSQGESLVVMGDNRVETHQVKVLGDPESEKPVSGIESNMCFIEEKEDVSDGMDHDKSSATSGSSDELAGVPDMHGSNFDKLDVSLLSEAAAGGENMSNAIATEDESMMNITMPSQINIIDAVEEIIADARNNKKTLHLELESVMKMMKEVELREQAAVEAKSQALKGDMNLMNQIDNFKGALQRAKEAYDMRAGEVYGERAILATELKELQSRVCSLSVERDKSLADLDEMRQSLEVRLAAAVNEIKCAELNKLEQGEVARKSLAEQELLMEKVVQESKSLRQQVDDNAKLHEFLVDRGRIVDTLQGELAVICHDVKKLKENFDQNVPLGKLLFSSHTSFTLASSTSSLKSLVPDQVEIPTAGDDDQSKTGNNTNDEKASEDEATRKDCKAFVENDGWEFFDRSEANA